MKCSRCCSWTTATAPSPSKNCSPAPSTGPDIHPREVVRRALLHNAAAVIVGHNHPSGNPEPSEADRAVTKRLLDSLELVDIRLLDHFVIGDGRPVSFAERGWLE